MSKDKQVEKLKEIISKYIPEFSVLPICKIIIEEEIYIRITKQRNSKYGDYRFDSKHSIHRISINHNLNPYHFLITLIHEIAHKDVRSLYSSKRISPHGIEWKSAFQKRMDSFLTEECFPQEVLIPLIDYMQNPSASTGNHEALFKALNQYNNESNNGITIESLENGDYFLFDNKRIFKREEKLRKRYKCSCIQTGKTYVFHPLAEVVRLSYNDDKKKFEPC